MTPKPRCWVAAAMAGTSSSGSLTGVCVACTQRRLGTAAEDVVDAEHVGEKQPVEQPALQGLRQFDPAIQPAIVARAVARMAPQSRRLMRDAVHLERVEADLLGHYVADEQRSWRGASQPAAAFRSEGATTLAMTSPNGPAFFAGPRSLPVVALRGSFGNTSSAKR